MEMVDDTVPIMAAEEKDAWLISFLTLQLKMCLTESLELVVSVLLESYMVLVTAISLPHTDIK